MRRNIRVSLSWFVGLATYLITLSPAVALEFPSQKTDPQCTIDNLAKKGQNSLAAEAFGRVPLYFVKNQGQKDARVQYYAEGSDYAVWFADTGIYFTFHSTKRADPKALHTQEGPQPARILPTARARPNRLIRVQLWPTGTQTGTQIEAIDPQKGKVHYFVGKDPKKWHRDIPTYKTLMYREVFKGIDLKFFGKGRQLEYDVIVKPGADPKQFRIQLHGVQGLRITPDGDLSIRLPDGGEIRQKKPLVYQQIQGKRLIRQGRFKIAKAEGIWGYGFDIGTYDSRHPLIIDPVTLVYSTYLGGSNWEKIMAIAEDDYAVYVTGWTDSTDFPVKDTAFQTELKGDSDAFVTSFMPDGSLLYSTYLGGSGDEQGLGIAVSEMGRAYVTGFTHSSDFPIKDAAQSTYGGNGDAFVTALDSNGSALRYSTYLGGMSWDAGTGIALHQDVAYVAGRTSSSDFPTVNPYQSVKMGDQDAFVAKINNSGWPLEYATYLGGREADEAKAIAVDGGGQAYVTGFTQSTDFPTKGSATYPVYQPVLAGGSDAFVTKFTIDGTALEYSTYLGGTGGDTGYGIALGWGPYTGDCAYVTGRTTSTDFPTQNPYQSSSMGATDVFVTKFDYHGHELLYSTYLGGSANDYGAGIAVDGEGYGYVAGFTNSPDFPTQDAYQSYGGFGDAFVTKFNPAGSTLAYSTFLGGWDQDQAEGIAVTLSGDEFVAGWTWSTDFPVERAYQPTHQGGTSDGFVTRLWHKPSATTADIKANGSNDPVTVSSATPVSITIALDPGENVGQNADWWIAVHTPFSPPEDWYTYVYPHGWWPGIHLCAQTGIFNLSPFEVLNMILPVGTYTFYFALDAPDGVATGPWIAIDEVAVTVY